MVYKKKICGDLYHTCIELRDTCIELRDTSTTGCWI